MGFVGLFIPKEEKPKEEKPKEEKKATKRTTKSKE